MSLTTQMKGKLPTEEGTVMEHNVKSMTRSLGLDD